MGRLTCRCLNVAVHYKGGAWAARAVEGARVVPSGHRLCGAALYEVELEQAGVTAEQPCLLLALTLGDWTVQTCSNCGCDVCVSHASKRRTFVCAGLLTTEGDISQVRGHPHYSTVFRISLDPDLEADGVMGRRRVTSMSFGRNDPAVKIAHTQVKEFLAAEEEEMEQRIRAHERRERDEFARLQQKTFTQRTLLFAAIAKARESETTGSESAPSPLSHPHSSHPHTITRSTSLPYPPETKRSVTITLSDARPPPNKAAQALLDGALFTLDGFDDEEEEVDGGKGGVAFPQSDDEESGTDDSSYRDLSSVQPVVASSAPLEVPMFRPSQHIATPSERETAPADMASSIKALALSVQNTGMFGDLPRPRVNSASQYK
jgi:hypothetical protein